MTSKPNTDNAGQAKEGHSIECHHIGEVYWSDEGSNYYCADCKKGMGVQYFRVAKELEECRQVLINTRELAADKATEWKTEIASLRSQLSEARNFADRIIFTTYPGDMRRKIADELRAILSSDGKAKEGGV